MDHGKSNLEAQVRMGNVEEGLEKSLLLYPGRRISSVHLDQSSPQLHKIALILSQVVLN